MTSGHSSPSVAIEGFTQVGRCTFGQTAYNLPVSDFSEQRTVIRVPLLFDGAGGVLRDAIVEVVGDQIVECRSFDVVTDEGQEVIHWKDAAIVPPLVNAHTHLEFSDLNQPVAAAGNFADWITAVIETRASNRAGSDSSAAAIGQGLRQSMSHGCVSVGEIATTPDKLPVEFPQGKLPMSGVQFLELLSASPDHAPAILSRAESFLKARQGQPDCFSAGLSPHAPYSTSMELVRGAVELARRYDTVVAMHLAESREEMELLATQTGPLADFLTSRGIWPPRHVSGNTSPMDYLVELARAPKALVIHGNYLDDEQRSFIASNDQLSVVYCPRTHAFFGHSRYPLAATLAAGVRVALGTDSRASNPDLNIWAEAQFVARHHEDVLASRILPMVTVAGSAAMGFPVQTINRGGNANFVVIGGLHERGIEASDEAAFQLLFNQSTAPKEMWIGGVAFPCD